MICGLHLAPIFGPSMLDQEVPEENRTSNLPATQLSLMEMFFITTLTAVALWVYVYVSPLVALMAGGVLIFVVILRSLGRQPVVIGGVAGFFVAMLLTWLVCLFGQLDSSATIIAMLFCPCIGYVVGACMTELADDGF